MSDRELLKQYQETGSESAFRGLVERYAGLVFAVALRRTGNRSAAEEVAQGVFVILAAKAGRLKSRGELASWLHRTTLLEASNAARRESVRQRKMEELVEMTQINADPDWPRIAPELDHAIDQLRDGDRSAVLLRFYEGLSFREVASTLGKTEAAARQQVSRALSKLSGILRRRGITTSAAVLGTGMAAHLSAGSVPAAAAATLSHGALAGAAGTSKTSLFLNSINTMAYAKTKTAVAVALLAAIPIGLQWNENRKLRGELASPETGSTAAVSSKSEGRRGASYPAGRGRGGEKVAGSAAASARFSRTPGAADWQRALYEQDPVQRSQRIAELIGGLDARNAPGIADLFFGEIAEKGFESEARLFLRAWAKMDGARAVSYLAERGQSASANPPMLAALGGWASTNPQAARVWAEGVENENVREDLLFGVIDGWALVDFKAAADYAETRPRSDARTRFIDLLFKRSLAAGGIAGTQNWFSGISDDDHNEIYKRRAFERIVSTMLHRDPSAAAHWIASQAEGRFVSGQAVQSTAMKLAQTSPEDALRWLFTMPALDEKVSSRSHGQVLGSWAEKEPEDAGHWLVGNMNHPHFDAMAGTYSASVAGVDGEGALEWAQAIQDDQMRDSAVIAVARRRMRSAGEGTVEDLLLAGVTRNQLKQAQLPHSFAGAGDHYVKALRAFDSQLRIDGSNSMHLADLVGQPETMRVIRNYELAFQAQTEIGALGAAEQEALLGQSEENRGEPSYRQVLLELNAAAAAGVSDAKVGPTGVMARPRFVEIEQAERE